MRFVIFGAGGIGGTIGARLHRSGHDVLLIARGAHLAALRANGLRFVSPTLDEHLAIPAVGHPEAAGLTSEDVVILCVKGQHTRTALDDLYASAPDDIPVICCQNGVANERSAARRFINVYGMVVLLPAEHLEPGLAVNFAEDTAGVLDVGRYPHGVDDTARDVAAALESAGFTAAADPLVMRQKYAKLLANLNNSVVAATGEPNADIARVLRNEALACFAAAGIDCATRDETRDRRRSIGGADVPGFERHGGSSLQSIMRGTGDIEADYLNGEITLLGSLHGVATPGNRVVQRVGNRMARERLAVGTYSADDLLALIAAEAD